MMCWPACSQKFKIDAASLACALRSALCALSREGAPLYLPTVRTYLETKRERESIVVGQYDSPYTLGRHRCKSRLIPDSFLSSTQFVSSVASS